jgi:hypothetical protein
MTTYKFVDGLLLVYSTTIKLSCRSKPTFCPRTTKFNIDTLILNFAHKVYLRASYDTKKNSHYSLKQNQAIYPCNRDTLCFL